MRGIQRLGLALLLILTAIQCGCAKSAKLRLIGKWELDTSRIAESIAENTPPDKDAKSDLARAFASTAKSVVGAMKTQLEFQSGGDLVVATTLLGRTRTETFKWKFVESHNDTVLLSIERPSGSQQLEVRLLDEDTMELTMPTGFALPAGAPLPSKATFIRVKAS